MDQTDGQAQTQDPRGLRPLPPRHPRRTRYSYHPQIERWSAGCEETRTSGAGRGRRKRTRTTGTSPAAYFTGKAHRFAGLIQALVAPNGIPLWLSDVRPGSTHDITATRELLLAALLPYLNDLPVLADCGYDGAAHGIYTPVKKRSDGVEHDPNTRTYNKLLRGLRCLGERGFALLTRRWKCLQQHITLSPERISDLARAALVLTQFEHKMTAQ